MASRDGALEGTLLDAFEKVGKFFVGGQRWGGRDSRDAR